MKPIGNNLETLRPEQRKQHITLKDFTPIGIASEVVDYLIDDCFPSLTFRIDAVESLCDHIERAYKAAASEASFCENATDATFWIVLGLDLNVHEVAGINAMVMRDDLSNMFRDYYRARSS